MDQRARILLAELVGTAILVIGGCGTAVYAAAAVGDFGGVGVFGVATAFGLSLLILAYAIGHVSGCHVNPAVTLGMVVGGKLDAKLAPVYWIGQILGGLAGGAALRFVFSFSDSVQVPRGLASNGYGEHSPLGFGLASVALVEVGLTALLIMVVLATTHPKFPAGFGGLAAGATLWLIHLISIPVSNTSVNPARSLGVAPFAPDSAHLKQVWAFLLFPLIGGAAGALIHRVISQEETEDTEGSQSTDGTEETVVA